MNVMFGASALLMRYIEEAGVGRVLQLQAPASAVTEAVHCKAEIASVLTRQWREGAFSAEEYQCVLADIHADFDELAVMPLSGQAERYANAAMRVANLRSIGALHIGTAQAALVDLFVTADARQATAAQAVGLKTELIEA